MLGKKVNVCHGALFGIQLQEKQMLLRCNLQ